MKPWRKLCPPTGPISPAQNAPATGSGPSSSSTSAGVVVGHAEEVRAAPVAREEQRARRPSTPGEQRAQVLVGGGRVADVELHGLADGRPSSPTAIAPSSRLGAEHVAHEEVAAAELGLVLVDDEARRAGLARAARARRRGRASASSASRSSAGLPGELVRRSCRRASVTMNALPIGRQPCETTGARPSAAAEAARRPRRRRATRVVEREPVAARSAARPTPSRRSPGARVGRRRGGGGTPSTGNENGSASSSSGASARRPRSDPGRASRRPPGRRACRPISKPTGVSVAAEATPPRRRARARPRPRARRR